MTGFLPRILERKHYSELRRRIMRRAVQPLVHASGTRATPMARASGADIHRILICRPNHRLGNLLLLTPLLTEIQRLLPNADVDIILAGEHMAELFETFPNVKHIYALSRRMVRHPIAVARTLLKIRKARYDLAIDPCEASQSSRLLVAAAGAKYVIGTGRAGAEAPAPSTHAPPHMAQWPVHRLRRALAPSSEPSSAFPALDLRLSADERQRAREVLERVVGQPHPEVVIGVFAEATGAKGYGREWWQRFIGVLRAQHPGAAIVEVVPADGRPRLSLPSLGSPSPREVAAMISNMTCFVSADCGVMHLASAAGTPTIGLFSVTDIAKYAPYGHGSRALDTNGKTPEEVAQEAGALIATCMTRVSAGSPDRSRADRHDEDPR
ncbi:MAG TPA: glycosyltransferase family 9 protein [Rhodanobacteraceae bacterium]|nr:glycosyltransferase family 9 protein [Rhodanobacteraceae bacterium]